MARSKPLPIRIVDCKARLHRRAHAMMIWLSHYVSTNLPWFWMRYRRNVMDSRSFEAISGSIEPPRWYGLTLRCSLSLVHHSRNDSAISFNFGGSTVILNEILLLMNFWLYKASTGSIEPPRWCGWAALWSFSLVHRSRNDSTISFNWRLLSGFECDTSTAVTWLILGFSNRRWGDWKLLVIPISGSIGIFHWLATAGMIQVSRCILVELPLFSMRYCRNLVDFGSCDAIGGSIESSYQCKESTMSLASIGALQWNQWVYRGFDMRCFCIWANSWFLEASCGSFESCCKCQ